MSITARQVVDALKHRYAGNNTSAGNVSTNELATQVRQIALEQTANDLSLLKAVASINDEWIPSPGDLSILKSVEDCMKMIHGLVDVEARVTNTFLNATPKIAAELLTNPLLPLQDLEYSLFPILDELLDATIGWTDDQGRAGEKLLTEVEAVIKALGEVKPDYKALKTDLDSYLDKDRSRIGKLEERLAASETGKLRSQRCRSAATQMVNEATHGQKLTACFSAFLHGPWYESIQLVALTRGLDSEDWLRAVKMTETLIWTYQPIPADDPKAAITKQKLYRIIEHLPSELRDLLVSLEHSTGDAESAISDIEEEHIAIISGLELEYVETEPLPVTDESFVEKATVSKILLRKVLGLQPGQWFIFEEDDKRSRIKLVLKLEDVQQMLFTNRNGMKALQKSFDELGYLMSSGIIKPLNHSQVFSSTFSTFYQGLVEEHEKKLQAAERADQQEAERIEGQKKAAEEARILAREKEEAEREQKAQAKSQRLEKARQEANKSENSEKVLEFTSKVKTLNVGAWLKLPGPDGRPEECKLAVRVTAADKLIFVTRMGTKMGEYTSNQLVDLLVTGEAVIDDTGVEFEDTLAQVVSKLRQDRGKSYDDLTRSEAES